MSESSADFTGALPPTIETGDGRNSSGTNQKTREEVIGICGERIAELEAENASLQKAIDELNNEKCGLLDQLYDTARIAVLQKRELEAALEELCGFWAKPTVQHKEYSKRLEELRGES